MRGRGRGRPRGSGAGRGRDLKNPPGRPPSDLLVDRLGTVSFPVTPIDEEIVQCAECGLSCKFREFRLHNMSTHYNIAKTTDDESPQDHKFFTRKLLEMSRLAKITTFFCPRKPCQATYKSALGLAFHLDGCGKTEEEIAAKLLECEVCHKKFSASTFSFHKKNAHAPQVFLPYPTEERKVSSGKRKSAIKALEFMKEISDIKVEPEEKDQDDYNTHDKTRRLNGYERDEDFSLTGYVKKEPRSVMDDDDDEEMDDENVEVTPSIDFILGSEEVKVPSKRSTDVLRTDFASQASKYLDLHPESASADPWDTPLRVTEDPLHQVILSINPLRTPPASSIRQYLPAHEKSILFNTKTRMKEVTRMDAYHRLNWFEGHTVNYEQTDFVSFAGGPVTAMAWHPSGNYLAVATLSEITETPNIVERRSRPASIQIYQKMLPVVVNTPPFALRLILASDFGYANHLQWSPFWPQLEDPDAEYAGRENGRMGYLCGAFEDSSCRVFALRQTDFQLKPTFTAGETGTTLPVYKKVPEINLLIENELKTSAGQCTCFDWDENSRYLVAGYASGHIAVFNVLTTSQFVKTVTVQEDSESAKFVVNLSPVWLIACHFSPVTAVVINPKSSRYFYSGSMDRTLRCWDMDLKQETESRRVGCVLDMCWIRGWIHLGVVVDTAVSNSSSQFNFLRFYCLGGGPSRPNNMEFFNIISTSFFEGMVLSGSENGRVSISYYDAFWRECDYDRNKRKRNLINIGTVTLDESTFEPIPHVKIAKDIPTLLEFEEPRLTFNFCRERILGTQEAEPTRDEMENVFRFYKFIRVNKVCWAPDGSYVTIGYRNGLFAIIPATFDKLFR